MRTSLHPESLASDPTSRSTSPRVVHLVPAMFGADGVTGGAERYAFELARHMAETVPTTLLSFGKRERQETMGPLRICVLGQPWYVRGQRFNPLKWSIFAELRKASVIHCHQQHVLASSLAAVFGRLSRRRVFVSDLGGGGWDISAYISTDRWFNGHLHISEYSRSIAGHRDKLWAHVIMGGVDSERFSPGPAVPRDRAVLFVGRLLPHKGVNYLIEALPEGMRLKLVGQAHDLRYFEALRNLAAGRCVEFHQGCDDAALLEHYRRAICVVLPSVYRTMYGDGNRGAGTARANSAGRDGMRAAGGLHRRGQPARSRRGRSQRFRGAAQRRARSGRAAVLAARPSRNCGRNGRRSAPQRARTLLLARGRPPLSRDLRGADSSRLKSCAIL